MTIAEIKPESQNSNNLNQKDNTALLGENKEDLEELQMKKMKMKNLG